ncbi:MAG: sulfur oxidation c-type cytochrome SoxA [Betaproteobacteria bacterium]
MKCAAALLLLWSASALAQSVPTQAPVPLKPGSAFQPADMRKLQADELANPAMLWVSQGEQLWKTTRGESRKSCADCHGNAATSMKAVATRYPRFQPSVRRMLNLEGQINYCVTERQKSAALAYESDELLALTAFVSRQSLGLPMDVKIDDGARPVYEHGRRIYTTRMGQLNLACTHCHQANWGRQLLTDTISQGHGAGYPGYRFEWQKIGSLQRRLRACYFGVRAEMPGYGSEELLALEMYLAVREKGLAIEVPGVRK